LSKFWGPPPLASYERGEPPWKLLFDKLGSYFDERFGLDWRKKERGFLSEFDVSYQVGKGIQERLKRDKRFMDKGFSDPMASGPPSI
jgi:hypothetical protein